MKYWLMKTEPLTYSIDNLEQEGITHWEGVRNYQARNFMKNEMSIDDQVLIYHSNTKPPGITGLARICSTPYPDFFALDEKSKYFDPKASIEKPIWWMLDVAFLKKFKNYITLEQLKSDMQFETMWVVKKGMRLSIQPVEKQHFDALVSLGG